MLVAASSIPTALLETVPESVGGVRVHSKIGGFRGD